MDKATTWRQLLGTCISEPRERQRVATELGVRPITLARWVSGESMPRSQHLRQLLTVLPQHRDTLIALIESEMPSLATALSPEAGEAEEVAIPGEFYMRVLQTRASLPKNLCHPALCELILEQAFKHLDPHRVGIGISIARCLPPAGGEVVRSLLTDTGRGSPPWGQHMEHEIMLLGAESLAGYAVLSGHLAAIPDLHAANNRLPASLGAWEESAVAAPITYAGDIAGSLLVSCTQPHYFNAVRQQLVSNYADLLAVAFEPEQFYHPHHIQLRVFPSQQIQQTFFVGFQQRLLRIIRLAAEQKQYMTVIQAQQLAWQQIEEELLQSQLTRANKQKEESYHGT